MSLTITLYTKNGTKSSLVKFLLSEGFQKTKHIADEINKPNILHYMWFSFDNYESSSGVEATIYMTSPEETFKDKGSEWVLFTRTRSCGSYEDKQKQNKTIRRARQLFKGTFRNDWYGTNKYTNLNDYPKYTPLEKGISLVVYNANEKLDQISNCLNGYQNELTNSLSGVNVDFLKELLKRKDPSVILYNSLMPFLVTVLEYFYVQCFVNFVKYDLYAKKQMENEKQKIAIIDVISIIENENSIEQIISKLYNFQNIESINGAYKKYMEIDILSILSQRKRVNGKMLRVFTEIQHILHARHKFVHELDINYDLTKQMYLNYVEVTKLAILLTANAFKGKGLTVKPEQYL